MIKLGSKVFIIDDIFYMNSDIDINQTTEPEYMHNIIMVGTIDEITTTVSISKPESILYKVVVPYKEQFFEFNKSIEDLFLTGLDAEKKLLELKSKKDNNYIINTIVSSKNNNIEDEISFKDTPSDNIRSKILGLTSGKK